MQKINEEKDNQQDIQKKTRAKEREIHGQHKEMGGVHASAQHTQKTQKAIRVKENRLHQVNNTPPTFLITKPGPNFIELLIAQ